MNSKFLAALVVASSSIFALSGCAADPDRASALSEEALTTEKLAEEMPRNDAPIWPLDVARLVAETSGGGFTPPPPTGSTCRLGAAKYTLDVAGRTLGWTVCNYVSDSAPTHPVSGSRPVTDAELHAVHTAMAEMAFAHHDMCGADKPLLKVRVTSASQGQRTFIDSFYSCMQGEGAYVDNIDSVFGVLESLAYSAY